jgi:hypothetical protein
VTGHQRADTSERKHTMSANRNNTLTLRKHSIRTLTPTELRVVNGGFNPQPEPPGSPHGSK